MNRLLIIIIKNIIGKIVFDFHKSILKHQIILYISIKITIVTG